MFVELVELEDDPCPADCDEPSSGFEGGVEFCELDELDEASLIAVLADIPVNVSKTHMAIAKATITTFLTVRFIGSPFV